MHKKTSPARVRSQVWDSQSGNGKQKGGKHNFPPDTPKAYPMHSGLRLSKPAVDTERQELYSITSLGSECLSAKGLWLYHSASEELCKESLLGFWLRCLLVVELCEVPLLAR